VTTDAVVKIHVVGGQDANGRESSDDLADAGDRDLGRGEEQLGRRVGGRAGLPVREGALGGSADTARITDDVARQPICDVAVHVGDEHALSRVADFFVLCDRRNRGPAGTVRVEGHDAHRSVDGREEAHVHVRFVWDAAVEEDAVVVDDTPAVATLRRERDVNDLRAVLREVLHLLVTLVGYPAVEERAILRKDAPVSTGTGRERNADDVVAGRGELIHLLVTLVRDASIEELHGHGDRPPTLVRPKGCSHGRPMEKRSSLDAPRDRALRQILGVCQTLAA
jgi:hypothetical protein